MIMRTESFNSRTLGRVRHKSNQKSRKRYVFQFTHPGKGATLFECLTFELYHLVSIHAPWEGCDSVVQSCVL